MPAVRYFFSSVSFINSLVGAPISLMFQLSRHRFTSIKKALTENYFSAKADSISYFC